MFATNVSFSVTVAAIFERANDDICVGTLPDATRSDLANQFAEEATIYVATSMYTTLPDNKGIKTKFSLSKFSSCYLASCMEPYSVDTCEKKQLHASASDRKNIDFSTVVLYTYST
jgi:hypothetical protein